MPRELFFMKYYFTLLIHFILLITTPMTLLACPQHIQLIDNLPNPSGEDLEDDVEDELPTYDDFLKFLEEVESDDLEKYTLDQVEWMVRVLALLAKNGVLPDQAEDEVVLDDDIQELLSDFTFKEPQPLSIVSCYIGDYGYVPAVYYGEVKIIPCNWFSKKWKHIKHFCHRHRKKIIIGSAIILAVAGVTYLYLAAEAAEAAGAAQAVGEAVGVAGAAGAAAVPNESGNKHSHKTSSHRNSKEKIRDASIKKVITDNIAHSLKENPEVNNDILLCDADDASCYARAIEATRHVVSRIAHDVVDGFADVGAILPAFMDEVKDVNDNHLPEWLKLPPIQPFAPCDDDDEDITHMERYQSDIAKTHEWIDYAFDDSLAEHYTPEAKAARAEGVTIGDTHIDGTTLGILPPPQGIGKEAGSVVAKGAEIVSVETLIAERKFLPKTLASNKCGWKVGQDITNRTRLGNVPKWSTVRYRYWKNKAYEIKSDPIFRPRYATPENIKRMEKGRAPQQFNDRTGRWESRELHHIPPQRDGGLFDVIELWPDEHATADKFRHIGK